MAVALCVVLVVAVLPTHSHPLSITRRDTTAENAGSAAGGSLGPFCKLALLYSPINQGHVSN